LSRQELRRREAEIIAFSEIGDFIDAPVRTYSSGMYVRLAFSVAVNVDPEILIIDEVLAVGDAHFAHKCKAKLDEFKRKAAVDLVVRDRSGKEQLSLTAGEPFSVDIHYRAQAPTDRVVFGVSLLTGDGQWLFGTNTRAEGQRLPTLSGTGHVRCEFPRNSMI